MSGTPDVTVAGEVPPSDLPDPDGPADGALGPLDVDDDVLRRGLAAVLFVTDEPVSTATLAETLGVDAARCGALLAQVGETLSAAPLGIELCEVAGGWRLMTDPTARPVLERWLVGSRHGRLTQAALETLAVVAYRQPIARMTIGEIRGVNPDGALRSLVARGLVTEVGREDGPGQAVLFGTTPAFLERMGLRTLDELPPVPPHLPDGPAPDEPDAGGLGELRRRLRDGSARLGEGGDATAARTDRLAAAGALTEDDDEPAMAPPRRRERPSDDPEIGDLSERLEQAARSAMGRLRSVRTEEPDPAEPGDAAGDATADEPGAGTADGSADG